MTLITTSCGTGVGDVGVYALLISYLEPPSIGDQLKFFSALSKISVDPWWIETGDPSCERLKKPLADLLKHSLGDVRKIGRKLTEDARLTISMTVLNWEHTYAYYLFI